MNIDNVMSIEKIFITIDMEGISGIVDWSQVGGDKDEYRYGRKLMVGDLNAAIEGALDAGVNEIVVSDAHGSMRNLLPEEVDESAYLIRGSPKPWSMMEGIDEGNYDAALYIGYHSMNGTKYGILAHTISGRAVDAIKINDREMGEFALNAALAGWYGVPSIFLAGDKAATEEAKDFVPDITTATIKWAVGRYAAKCLHPEKSRKLIKRKVNRVIKNGDIPEPFTVDEPVNVELHLNSPAMADVCDLLPYVDRLDGRTISFQSEDYPTAIKGLRAAIYIANTAENS